jgi:hypothetical protein
MCDLDRMGGHQMPEKVFYFLNLFRNCSSELGESINLYIRLILNELIPKYATL